MGKQENRIKYDNINQRKERSLSRIAIIGFSGEKLPTGSGGGAALMRTERFRSVLEENGHDVKMFSPSDRLSHGREVRKFLKENGRFDGIVAISMNPALAAVRSRTELPLWIDLNGAHLAEMQIRASIETTREILARTIHQESLLLRRGDHFSTVSDSQRLAVIGELLILGVPDGTDISHEMVLSMENCALSIPEKRTRNRQEKITILSSGSFNLWFDGDTLFNALEIVMKEEQTEFISVGGAIPHSPHKYNKFKNMVSKSKFAERMHIRSWVDNNELEKAYEKADIAVYTDIPCYETELGARTRVLDWISRGIPVVCTKGAGISQDIEIYRLGITVHQQDSQALASAITTLIENNNLYNEIVDNQIRWCANEGSPERVFAPLLKWAEAPHHSPFKDKPIGKNPVAHPRSPDFLFRMAIEHIRRTGISGLIRRILRKISRG